MLSRETGKRRRLLRGGSNVLARYTGTGHLVFSDGDALRAVPVNQRFEPVGDPTPVLHGIDQDYRHSNVALSDNGTVIYVAADRVREAELLWLDRDGNATPVPGGRVPFETVALSPDGREVAGDLVDGTKEQVWVRDLERGDKAPARLRGRQLSADLEPGWQIHHLLVDARQHRGFSEACGWDWLRRVAHASADCF